MTGYSPLERRVNMENSKTPKSYQMYKENGHTTGGYPDDSQWYVRYEDCQKLEMELSEAKFLINNFLRYCVKNGEMSLSDFKVATKLGYPAICEIIDTKFITK
jgi:hypothetical protein